MNAKAVPGLELHQIFAGEPRERLPQRRDAGAVTLGERTEAQRRVGDEARIDDVLPQSPDQFTHIHRGVTRRAGRVRASEARGTARRRTLFLRTDAHGALER